MGAYTVPPGVPSLLTSGQVAAALNLPERRVRTWLENGRLPFWQDSVNSWRWIRAADLLRFAHERGLPCDWEAVI